MSIKECVSKAESYLGVKQDLKDFDLKQIELSKLLMEEVRKEFGPERAVASELNDFNHGNTGSPVLLVRVVSLLTEIRDMMIANKKGEENV